MTNMKSDEKLQSRIKLSINLYSKLFLSVLSQSKCNFKLIFIDIDKRNLHATEAWGNVGPTGINLRIKAKG